MRILYCAKEKIIASFDGSRSGAVHMMSYADTVHDDSPASREL